MKRSWLVGLVMLAGCGAAGKPETPEDPNGRLAAGREMMIYSDKHDPVFVVPQDGELIETAVGTMVTVVADVAEETKDGRVVRIRLKEGKSAGTLGLVDRFLLRPPLEPAN